MAGSAFAITGQGAVAKHLSNLTDYIVSTFMGGAKLNQNQIIGRIFDQIVTDLPLEWVTPESEDQREH